MPLPIYTYGNPGDATYSVSLASLDAVMSTTPDNTINQITAKNIRDVNLTIFEYVANNLTQNLYQVTNNGNTSSNRIQVGGLQVNGGTSSFKTNVGFLSTISDINGSTGSNPPTGAAYILSASGSGVQWIPNYSTVPNLQQVLLAGSSATNSYTLGGIGIFNGSLIFNGGSSASWAAIFNKSLILASTITDINSKTGPSGYILAATAGGVVWIPNTGGSSPTLQQVTTAGSTTSNAIQVGSLQVSGTSSFTGAVSIKSNLYDRLGLSGSTGWVLTTKPSGIEWAPVAGSQSLQQVNSVGNTTSNGISVQNPTIVGSVPSTSIYLSATSGYIQSYTGIQNTLHPTVGTLYYKGLWFMDGGNNQLNINIAPISATSTFTIPNITGTAAVLSNITLDQSLSGGNTSSKSMQIGSLQVTGTSSFIATASFVNGISDNLNNIGTQYQFLSLDINKKVAWASAVPLLINNVSANYTLVASDIGKFVIVNSAGTVFITVPTNASASLPVGTSIDFARYGSGVVSFTSSTGVTINSQLGYRSITAQYVAASLIQTSTNVWVLIGNLSI